MLLQTQNADQVRGKDRAGAGGQHVAQEVLHGATLLSGGRPAWRQYSTTMPAGNAEGQGHPPHGRGDGWSTGRLIALLFWPESKALLLGVAVLGQ